MNDLSLILSILLENRKNKSKVKADKKGKGRER